MSEPFREFLIWTLAVAPTVFIVLWIAYMSDLFSW